MDPTAPRDLPDILPTAERVALLDPGFHPVLSFPDGMNYWSTKTAGEVFQAFILPLDVSNNIHLEAIMNITEWQSKMIRSSPKSIMKHAHKQLELLGAVNGENGNFKDSVKSNHMIDEKKVRKGNIDLLTGKRKYTKKLLKLDGVLSSSKYFRLFANRNFSSNFLSFTFQNSKRERSTKNGVELSPWDPPVLMCRVNTRLKSECER